jgi:type IV secretory pathway VirB2 component (pilin)
VAIVLKQSLLEADGGSAFGSAIEWINGVLMGELAAMLSVIAVAIVGFTLLTGQLNLRLGGRVVLGIFLLLGAPVIAAAFSASWGAIAAPAPVPVEVYFHAVPPRPDLPPADYDPYAGASLRQD